MKTLKIVGLLVLAALWCLLAYAILSWGVTLYKLLVVAASGIIVFVPLWRKYGYLFTPTRSNGKQQKPNE